MKMEKFIISAILIFALTNHAYGMGSHHHHDRGRNSGGSTTTGDSVAVPEPATILLLGSGLIGLAGLARKKFKK